MKFVLALALVALAAGAPSPQKYAGQQVVRTYPATTSQVRVLQKLEETLDFWSSPRLNGPTDIRITVDDRASILSFLAKKGIKYDVLIEDVEKAVREEELSQVRSTLAMDWTSYHGLDEIQSWFTDLVSQNKDIAEVIDIGRSTQGRKMLVVRIGYPSANGAPKKAYFADGGIHAREWVAPTIVTYAINELLTNRATHEELLRSVDLYFLPNANPDGYEYSRQSGGDRMWRKTRSNNGNNNCLGVDPNRNFNVHFGGDGTSANLCSEIYKGPNAFSEPETKAMSDFINNRASADWRVYNAFHSYAQMILTPWGYTYALPDDYSQLKSLGNQAATAIKASAGKTYEVGSVTELLSPGAGGSDDWAKGSGNFKYSYTLEVRDTGAYGFLLPANQILPTARENFAAILVQANFIKNSA